MASEFHGIWCSKMVGLKGETHKFYVRIDWNLKNADSFDSWCLVNWFVCLFLATDSCYGWDGFLKCVRKRVCTWRFYL